MTFCNDTDLLAWEPNLPRDAAFASQTLVNASAMLAGTTLTISGANLTTSGVAPGDVVNLVGEIAGCYAVTAVTSATVCTISVYGARLAEGIARPIGTAAGLTARFRSFYAQRRIVSDMLLRACGVEDEDAERVVDAEALRRPCALGTLQIIYSAMAAGAGSAAADLIVRSQLYERLYRRSLRDVRVGLDTDGDGIADVDRVLSMTGLIRA